MANNSPRQVAVGKPKATGAAFSAPLGTVVPVDLTTALVAAYLNAGYVSSDGVVQSIGADSNDVVAWGGDTVRKIQTSHDLSYALTLIETNVVSTGIYYGDDRVTLTPATATTGEKLAIRITSGELPHKVWVFELVDGARKGRIVLPDAQVSERGDVSFIDDDAVSYGLTLAAYPDATGTKGYIYWDNGVSI